jgi:hypothetical protein
VKMNLNSHLLFGCLRYSIDNPCDGSFHMDFDAATRLTVVGRNKLCVFDKTSRVDHLRGEDDAPAGDGNGRSLL